MFMYKISTREFVEMVISTPPPPQPHPTYCRLYSLPISSAGRWVSWEGFTDHSACFFTLFPLYVRHCLFSLIVDDIYNGGEIQFRNSLERHLNGKENITLTTETNGWNAKKYL